MVDSPKSKKIPALPSQDTFSPWVRIVIVAYNSGEDLQKCVDALARQSDPHFEAVIVDNDTTDNCITTLILPDYRFSIATAPENLGFSAGSNFGLENAPTPYVMTLNPDVRLKRNCLMRLRNAANARPTASMLAPVLLRAEKKKRVDGLGDVLSIFGIAWRGGYNQKLKRHAPKETQQIFAPCGAAAVYRTNEFNHHGGFDSAFFCYLEDVDLGLRINASGGYTLLVHNAKAYHVGSASTRQISGFREYYSSRNNLRMIIKSVPFALCLVMVPGYILSQAWINLRNLKDPRTKHRVRGYRDALKNIPSSLKARWQRPGYKFGSSLSLAKKLVWQRENLRTLSPKFWDLEDIEEFEPTAGLSESSV